MSKQPKPWQITVEWEVMSSANVDCYKSPCWATFKGNEMRQALKKLRDVGQDPSHCHIRLIQHFDQHSLRA